MKKQSNLASLLSVLALIVLCLGVVQICLFVYVQTKMIVASSGSAAVSDILDFIFQQFVPPLVLYIVTSGGIASLLYAGSIFYRKLFCADDVIAEEKILPVEEDDESEDDSEDESAEESDEPAEE